VRIDSGVVSGSTVPPYYDSLLAKVVVWHSDRDSALARARRALSELRVEGVETTTEYLESVLAHPSVRDATHHTKFLEHAADQLLQGIS
jgi:acetyl-CoA carboxylase biotin carboxylase subunit